MPHLSLSDVLIVFALESEAQECFVDITPTYCGVGKVNATYHLTRRLVQWRHERGMSPKLVLNLGSAGSAFFKAGNIVNCTHFVQRDFDVTSLGCNPYATPYENVPVTLTNGLRYPLFPEGICGTGDNFVTAGIATEWNVVDMEAYAFAKVCYFENISFGCLKYITDGANDQAAGSWETSLENTARNLRKAALYILEEQSSVV